MSPPKIVPLLLDWFEHNARDLPWRRTRDPYAIWVSEIMLQQTQVKTVLPFWERWMRQLPTIRSLAKAKPGKIHKLWEGLGYYSRVRNMQKAARVILSKHSGKFPVKFEDVLALPGIGPYTAGAICSIAFNQPRPILDGNVTRVLTRLYGIRENPRDRQVHARLWALAGSLVQQAYESSGRDQARLGDRAATDKIADRQEFIPHLPACSHLNQSLMELGALVCTPRRPQCLICPVAAACVAREKGLTEVLPRTPPRQTATRRRFVAFVASHRGKVLVRQRPAGVVNAHLWEFPSIEVSNKDGDPGKACRKELGIVEANPTHMGTIQHTITRYRIRLDVFGISAQSAAKVRPTEGRWVGIRGARALAFASAHKKILALVQDSGKLKLSTRPANRIKREV